MTSSAAALLRSRVSRIIAMEKTVGQGNWSKAEEYLSPQLKYRVGARPILTGVPAFRQYMELQASVVDWIGHTTHLEAMEGDAVVIEVTSHFKRRSDQHEFDLPCCDIYRFDKEERIYDWKVFADIQLLGLLNDV